MYSHFFRGIFLLSEVGRAEIPSPISDKGIETQESYLTCQDHLEAPRPGSPPSLLLFLSLTPMASEPEPWEGTAYSSREMTGFGLRRAGLQSWVTS